MQVSKSNSILNCDSPIMITHLSLLLHSSLSFAPSLIPSLSLPIDTLFLFSIFSLSFWLEQQTLLCQFVCAILFALAVPRLPYDM